MFLLKIFLMLSLGCFKNFQKVKYNLKWNGDIIKIFQDDVEILINFLENLREKDEINSLDSHGMSLIHYCILYGDVEKLEILLEKGADLNLKTSSGKNVLLLCLERKELNSEKNLDNTPKTSFLNKKILSNIKREFVVHLIFKENFDTNFSYNNLTFEQYINKCYQISLKLKEKSVEALYDVYFYEDVLAFLERKRRYDSLNIYDKSIVEPIFDSLFDNDLEALKIHLNKFNKEEIRKIYFDNKNLLQTAIAGNLVEIAKFLIPYFNLNELQINEDQFLHSAAYFLRKEILIELLKAGADPNVLDFGNATPLFVLCNHYLEHLKADKDERKVIVVNNLYLIPFEDKFFEEILDILIEYGADINKVFSNKFTYLHLAVLNNNSKLAEILLNRGAEINLKKLYSKNKNIKNLNIEDLLLMAINKDNIEIVNMLMKRGADISSLEFYNILYSLNPDSKMFETIIFNLKKLESYPALLEKNGTLLFNTLYYFTKNSSKNINIKVIERLIKDFKEDVNYMDKDLFHRSCLQIAIQTRSVELVELILKYGAKTNIKNASFQPLSRAIMLSNLEMVKVLLKYGANPSPYSKEKYRGSPLMVAIERDEKEIVEQLLKSDKAFLGNYEIIISAINHPNTLDLEDVYKKEIIPDNIFNTLLHLACTVSNYKAVRFLLNNGHSPFKRSTEKSDFLLFSQSSVQVLGVNTSKINMVTINKDQRAIDVAIKSSNLNAFSIMIENYNEKILEKNIEEFIRNNFIFGNKTLIVNFEKEYYGIIKSLLKYDQFKDLNLNINYVDEDRTILDYAVEIDNKEFIDLFKSYGALLSAEIKESIKREEREQSLIFNISEGNLNKVKEILRDDKNKVLVADENNITPLTQSVINNNEKIFNLIISALKSINKLNANIDRVDIENKTALTYAIENKSFNIIKTLLENRANPNFRYARQYSYIIELALDQSNKATNIIQILFDYKIRLNLKDIKFLFKNKEKVNILLLKLFKEEIEEYEKSYFKKDVKTKDTFIDKILIDKEALNEFNTMEKDNKNRFLNELKRALDGKSFSDSRDIVGYKPKFGEIRLINSISSDRIFYIKKKNYLIIVGVYLNKRKRVLPIHIYNKAFEKCKLYKNLINKNKIEELENYLEVLKIDD